MIGYDLVAIEHANQSKHVGKPSFHEKILTAEELALFQTELREQNFIWVIWAIKESAFKCLPVTVQGRFNPHRLIIKSISVTPDGYNAVSAFEKLTVWSRTVRDSQIVRAISVLNKANLDKITTMEFRCEDSKPGELSRYIREKVIYFVKQNKNKSISISNSENGKPVVVLDNVKMEIISFSHDGDYVGFAYFNA